jgi:hypothetical protein
MKRAFKKKSSVYAYLNSTKVLETGNDLDIALARKAYWKAYKTAWRKSKRKELKQFVIALTANETKQVAAAAKMHKRSVTWYIKKSCFAYMTKQYLAVDPIALATIRQLLAMNLNALHKLFDDNKLPFDTGRKLLAQMEELEQKVMHELYHPKEHKENGM